MPHITKLKLTNFKRFPSISLEFNDSINTIIGDNEAGKSSILQAIELVAGGSRGKVETIGFESLINKQCVEEFNAAVRNYDNLPHVLAELFLSDSTKPELTGKHNTENIDCAGLYMVIEPNEELTREINDALAAHPENFPYEYYVVRFYTFSGEAYAGYRRFLKCLSIDSSQINSEYANREYIKTVYESAVSDPERALLKNEYRLQKSSFKDKHLSGINKSIDVLDFALRSGSKYNLETDITLTEDDIPIDERGKGHQCFIKTEFALTRNTGATKLDVLLLEEPENHLSHTNMKKLIHRVSESHGNQIIIATHSSLISTRLDLKNATLLSHLSTHPLNLRELSADTARFFMKAPDNNALEFILSKKVILVEGNAEFILLDVIYKQVTERSLEEDSVHVISIGGISFKRYMELAEKLGIRCAVIRDNDKDYHGNCVDNYKDYVTDTIRVFSDPDDSRYTLEVCIYQDNKDLCDRVFSGSKTKTPLEVMLASKAEGAFFLAEQHGDDLVVPDYLQEAIHWINE
tara:strand:+ start:1781 stop:3343 length:1563 start_codon:yes stop_codon:yes gene_type:complete